MAAKKIGALITLDGEKEFKQNVTSCNKSLSALRSEMKLVEASCDGQANTLESLTKKHEVLTKILEEQKRKEEAVQQGLEHSKQDYERVGQKLESLNRQQETHAKRLEELRGEYDTASKRLDAMTKAGNSSEQSMRKQEAVVNSLSEQLAREETALEDVNTALSKGERSYQTAGNRVKDWETKLNTAQAQLIRANSDINKNAAYMKEAQEAADHCATSIDAFGKEVKDAGEVSVTTGSVIKANLVSSMTDLAKTAGGDLLTSITATETAQKQLQASTGATADEMKDYKSVMDDLYSNNYGEDIGDIADAMAMVKQYTGEMDPTKLRETTESAIAMRDVFDMDFSETIRGVDTLVTAMGVDGQEAFDLMAKGAQNGLNKSGELADNIAEYGPLWSQAGFSAKEMFTIMENGLDSGAYNLDKVNDFVKEFGISLSDGRIEENLDSFSTGTQNLFKQWKNGQTTTRDVFYSVINDLEKAENQQEALTIASNTWSSLGEDNAMDIIASLNDVNDTYEDVKGTMESVKDIRYDTLESRLEQLGRKFQTEIGEPVVETILPGMEEGLDLVIENMDLLIPAMGGVAAGAAVFKTATTLVTAFTTATEGATLAQTLLNTVCNANPFVLLVTGITAAATALTIYAANAGEASAEVQKLVEENDRVCESANRVADESAVMRANIQENAEQMDAQGQYAKTLAERIETLAGKERVSNAEKEVMRGYIAELNELVPELNLAYDEQAGKLNMTNEELENYLENSQREIELQAVKEQAIELIKQRTELEIEAIKIETEAADLKEQSNKLLEEENDFLMQTDGLITWIAGKSDERESYKELTEAQEENAEAQKKVETEKEALRAQLEATQEKLSEYGISIGDVTAAEQTNAEATKNSSQAYQDAAAANAESAQAIAETYTGMQETLSGVLESQMNMFQEFDAGTEISTSQLLSNMESQIAGVSNWADNMAALADRGINQNLLAYLAEMGPEGAAYVAAFAEMSDAELEKANAMWQESMDMKSGTQEAVQGMLNSYTEALNGGKEQVSAAMQSIGADSIQGLVNAVEAGKAQVNAAGQGMGETVVDGTATGAGTHSPSWKTAQIGSDVAKGLENGLRTASSGAFQAGNTIAQQLITAMGSQLQPGKFSEYGRNVSQGIATGIRTSQSQATSQVRNLGEAAKNAASAQFTSARYMQEGRNVPTGVAQGIRMAAATATNTAEGLGRNVQNTMNAQFIATKYIPAGRSIPTGVASGIRAGTSVGTAAAATMASSVRMQAANIRSLYSVGLNLAQGLASGIRAGTSSVINATASMCASAVSTARSKLKINSPSKVFEEIGGYMAQGQGEGYRKGMESVNAMIREATEIPQIRKSNGLSIEGFSGTDMYGIMRKSVKEAMVEALKYAKFNVFIRDREAARSMKNMGVVFQ